MRTGDGKKMVFSYMIVWSSASIMILGALASADEFEVSSCSDKSGPSSEYFVLETLQPSTWPADKFCSALDKSAAETGNYNMTVQLFNEVPIVRGSLLGGHPGIAFNAKDSMNYDFFYLRLHTSSVHTNMCYQTGYIKEGVLYLSETSTCPNGPPKQKTWFTIRLEVRDHEGKVFLDGDHVVTISNQHECLAAGGAIVANGYINTVFFRAYRTETNRPVAACASHTTVNPEYNTLDALNGTSAKWPDNGFCRVLVSTNAAGTKYRLSVDLYNAEGRDGINFGHLGVMYNAEDIDNFDFVYFRLHFTNICFQTGYVRDGQVTLVKTGPCPNGNPSGGQWFNMAVQVDGKSAAVYRDGGLVYTATPNFQPRGNGGVIVANGYKNAIRYKSFSITSA